MYVKCQRNWSPPKIPDLSRPFRKGRIAIGLSNAPIALSIGRPNSSFCDLPRTVGFVREARLRHRDAFRPVSRIPVSPEASITRARQGELPKAVATGVPSREARRSRSLRPTVVVGIALRAIRAPTPSDDGLDTNMASASRLGTPVATAFGSSPCRVRVILAAGDMTGRSRSRPIANLHYFNWVSDRLTLKNPDGLSPTGTSTEISCVPSRDWRTLGATGPNGLLRSFAPTGV